MTTKQKILFGLLILGLIFSSMVRMQFNLSDGFVLRDMQTQLLPLPIFDFAKASKDLSLTSTIIGYLFFVVPGVLLLLEAKNNKLLRSLWVGFLLITVYATYFEWTSLMQDIHSHFIGQHLRMGPVLFLLGLILFVRNYQMERESRETASKPLVAPTKNLP